MAQMLKGGIIMDVVNAEQARIAEEAGACAVMALERVPADIRKDGGVARMADPQVNCLSSHTCTHITVCYVCTESKGNQGGGDYSSDGQVPYWTLCGGPDLGEPQRRRH